MATHTIDHPLVQDIITQLRDKSTGSKDFRELVTRISTLLCYEAARDLKLEVITVETPMAQTKAPVLCDQEIMVVPIIRAGLAMSEGLRACLPEASIGYIGIKRDEETLAPQQYYQNFPMENKAAPVFICDPMLGTGGSAVTTIDALKADGYTNIRFIGIFAAPEGIAAIENKHADVPMYLGVIDEGLNDIGYMVPGVGDAGDRLFGVDRSILGDNNSD